MSDQGTVFLSGKNRPSEGRQSYSAEGQSSPAGKQSYSAGRQNPPVGGQSYSDGEFGHSEEGQSYSAEAPSFPFVGQSFGDWLRCCCGHASMPANKASVLVNSAYHDG